jgi:NADPH:quinone reductase-like Zn-dependent oxidoreductase
LVSPRATDRIAASFRAHVIATTSRRNHDFEHALGAPTVLDYTSEDVVKAIKLCKQVNPPH